MPGDDRLLKCRVRPSGNLYVPVEFHAGLRERDIQLTALRTRTKRASSWLCLGCGNMHPDHRTASNHAVGCAKAVAAFGPVPPVPGAAAENPADDVEPDAAGGGPNPGDAAPHAEQACNGADPAEFWQLAEDAARLDLGDAPDPDDAPPDEDGDEDNCDDTDTGSASDSSTSTAMSSGSEGSPRQTWLHWVSRTRLVSCTVLSN